MNLKTNTAKTIAKGYFSFSLLFGFYMMSHGHISHGAGFAGGVIIALGFIYVLIKPGNEGASKVINSGNAKFVMLLSAAALLIISMLGYFYGNGFMSNFLALGKPFSLFSAGITVIYNISLCFGVLGCLIYIYLSFFSSVKKG